MEKGKLYRSKVSKLEVLCLDPKGQLVSEFYGQVTKADKNFGVGEKTLFIRAFFEPVDYSKEATYERAIRVWGIRSQLEMLQEESTELALAVRKYIRFGNDETLHDVFEEIADAEIMIEQFKLMTVNAQSKIDSIKKHKIDRLAKRLDDFTD